MLVARRNCSLMSLLTTSAITQSCRRARFRSLFSLIDVAAPGAARFLAKRPILRDDAVSDRSPHALLHSAAEGTFPRNNASATAASAAAAAAAGKSISAPGHARGRGGESCAILFCAGRRRRKRRGAPVAARCERDEACCSSKNMALLRDNGRNSNFAKSDALPADFRDRIPPEARSLEQGMHPRPHKPVVRPTPRPNHPAVCFPAAVAAE